MTLPFHRPNWLESCLYRLPLFLHVGRLYHSTPLLHHHASATAVPPRHLPSHRLPPLSLSLCQPQSSFTSQQARTPQLHDCYLRSLLASGSAALSLPLNGGSFLFFPLPLVILVPIHLTDLRMKRRSRSNYLEVFQVRAP